MCLIDFLIGIFVWLVVVPIWCGYRVFCLIIDAGSSFRTGIMGGIKKGYNKKSDHFLFI